MNTEITFDRYRVYQADPHNWRLEKETDTPAKTKDGILTGLNVVIQGGYYDTLGNALRAAVRDGLSGQGAVSATQLANHIDACLACLATVVAAVRS